MDEAIASSELVDRLSDALRHQKANLAIYQHYRDAHPRDDFAALLDSLCQDAQEAIEGLASALRRAGQSPLAIEAAPRLVEQGFERRGTMSRLQFVLVGTQNNIAYYRTQLAGTDEPEAQALWAELLAVSEKQLSVVKALLQSLEHREAAGETQAQP
ncbi:MAG: hypothetical protein IT330_19660 [Anaerolineae bacterium]|nr:hypothetical protein [Anaerolineae bacterium]